MHIRMASMWTGGLAGTATGYLSNEIDKTIGIKSPEDVLKMGVQAYNAECYKIIMR